MRPPLATPGWGTGGPKVGGAGGPLDVLLSRYPSIDEPGIENVSMRHMQGMAKRANTSASTGSVLRDFLAGV